MGAAPDVCNELVGPVADRHRALGLQLVGAFRTAMRADDEVVVIWAVPDWDTWARIEAATDAAALRSTDVGSAADADSRAVLSAGSDGRLLSRERILLVDAELSPLRIGRQPAVGDRRSLDEF